MLEGGNLRWDRAQHCLTEGSLRSLVPVLANFRPLTASSPPKQHRGGRTLRCDWGSYPPVLFKRKFPVPITLPVLSRRHPGDFEGLAAVVLDVADNVLQDLRPLRFGSVGAVEGALTVDFAENSGSQAVVEERVVETQGSVLELLHEDDDAVRGGKRSLERDA